MPPALRNAPRLTLRWCLLAVALLVGGAHARTAHAAHDPQQTPTIYVHGFDLSGAQQEGTYGDVLHEAVADSIAALAGLPTALVLAGRLPRNVVLGVGYYGDAPPAWYTAAESVTVDSVTAVWGGGVPRYATIVALFAKRVLARTGATQVNLVSASFGSLVTRWLVEKDVEGLAGAGRIARWLTVEGVLGGNWAATHARSVLDFASLDAIDLEHMTHGWIDAHLHLPHSEGDSPLYAGILVGQIGSTDDRYNDRALSLAMAAERDWQPNDGVQALPDALFQSFTPRSRLAGLPPTRAVFHATHLGLEDVRGAWAEAATFLTQRRRVTVTMTSATVRALHEPDLPFWDWRPAEVVLESRVHSPAVRARWNVADPICEIVADGGAAPLRRFHRAGDTHAFEHVVFDDFVLREETVLELALRAREVDYDARYGVYETASTPYFDDLGGGTLVVSALAPALYDYSAADWSCRFRVEVTEYPFSTTVGVPGDARDARRELVIVPNPSRGAQTFRLGGPSGRARVEILDVTGRRVRDLGDLTGTAATWDGRDDAGHSVPAGLYLVRAATAAGIVTGRSLVVR